jgi:hypothetical protein
LYLCCIETNQTLRGAVKNYKAMEAKDKAKELVRKFSTKLPWYSEKDNLNKAKQCALICVDEMLEMSYSGYQYDSETEVPFLEEVKQEINKL